MQHACKHIYTQFDGEHTYFNIPLSLILRSLSTGIDMGFPFTHHLVFFVIELSMIFCLILGLMTPRSLDKQPEPAVETASEVVAPNASSTQQASVTTNEEDPSRRRRGRFCRPSLDRSLVYSGPQYFHYQDVEKKFYING